MSWCPTRALGPRRAVSSEERRLVSGFIRFAVERGSHPLGLMALAVPSAVVCSLDGERRF